MKKMTVMFVTVFMIIYGMTYAVTVSAQNTGTAIIVQKDDSRQSGSNSQNKNESYNETKSNDESSADTTESSTDGNSTEISKNSEQSGIAGTGESGVFIIILALVLVSVGTAVCLTGMKSLKNNDDSSK